MLDEIKKLKPGDLITIDDPGVARYANARDHEVTAVRGYTHDEGEFAAVDLDGFTLVAHTFAGDPQYFFTEDMDEDDVDGLADELPTKIWTTHQGKRSRHQVAAYGVVESLVSDDQSGSEMSLGVYRGKIKPFNTVVVEAADGEFVLHRGFRIRESAIIL